MRARVQEHMCVHCGWARMGESRIPKYMPSQVSLQSLTKGVTNASLPETTKGAYLAATKRRTLRSRYARLSIAGVKTNVQVSFRCSRSHIRFALALVIRSVASALPVWAFSHTGVTPRPAVDT